MMEYTLGTFKPTPEMIELVNKVLASGRLSYGPVSREFEDAFAALHQQKYGILSNSGTSSLVVAIAALKEIYGWWGGDEVICPAITFVATANAVLQNHLKPVLVDVDPDHYDMNVDAVKAKITNRTVAVLAVDMFGQAPELEQLRALCDQYNIKLIEDACEAMLVDGIGKHSHVAVFSFYMAHILTAGVGGISITNDLQVAEVMRSLVNHGIAIGDLPVGESYDPTFLGRNFRFLRPGHSFRITEIEAAIAIHGLSHLLENIAKRQNVAGYLNQQLAPLEGVYQLPRCRWGKVGSWMVYPIVLKLGNRDELMAYLRKNHIECRTMMPLTNQPVYARRWHEADYPVAQNINRMGFYVGCHQDIASKQANYLVYHLSEYAKGFMP